ncbi:hypothetical protein P261_02699 [Lachnospiraceae bacterium TWA4]|nr:hypothetical protein P261_02699 [Lachnospiraceae bacterium TWA4]
MIVRGEYDKGIILLQIAQKRGAKGPHSDGITLFLRLAEYEFLQGNVKKGIEYLTHVCEEETSNYEESIEFRGLTDVWLKYKPYVEGKVRESIQNGYKKTKSPSECTKSMDEILSMIDEDKLLKELSIHMNELSADGEELNYLNNWEKKLFYINQLWEEVNSGGFDTYLYYHGRYFERAKKSASEMEMNSLVDLLVEVEKVFPRARVPKKQERIQEIMDDKELNFDDLDMKFYESMDGEISKGLIQYIRENGKKLR